MAEMLLLAGLFVAAALAVLLTDPLPVPREAVTIVTGLAVGHATAVPDIAFLAEAGGVLLVFLVTLHVQTGAVRDVLPSAARVVAVQAVLLLAAVAAALHLGAALVDAVLLGLACSASSSMLGLDLVGNQVDRRLLHGRLTEAVTLGQDVAAVALIAALPFFTRPPVAVAAGLAALLGVGLAVRAHPAVRRGLSWLARDGSVTVMTALTVLWLVAGLLAGHPYGTVLAAVLAGLLLAAHPENLVLVESLEPITDFFAALFFVALGALAAPLSPAAVLVAAVLVLVVAVVRPVLTVVVLFRRDVDLHAAFTAALQLDQVSEIVLLLGLLLTAASGTAFQAVVLAAAATFTISHWTTRRADKLYPVLHGLVGRDREPVDRTGHVIIAGYGALGRAAASAVDDPVVIDNDPDRVAAARDAGLTALLGDLRDHAMWSRAALPDAAAVVLAAPSDRVALDLASRDIPVFIAVTATPDVAARCREMGAVHATDRAALTGTALRTALDAVLDDHLA